MDSISFGIVMVAAVMHAGWNLFVKRDDDQFLSLTVMAVASGLLCGLLLPFMPPITANAWNFLAVSVPLHAGYRVCLSLGYKYGDMSQVYPIARGATPLLVTLISLSLLDVRLNWLNYAGIVVIAGGIIGLTFYRGFPKQNEGRAILFALGTAAFIAVFTLIDSKGARASSSPYAYVLWLFLLEGAAMAVVALAVSPAALRAYTIKNGKTCLVNGMVMSMTHALIILALSRSEPALVSALRETSVVFGIVFSAVFLKERVGPLRMTCAVAVTAGLFLIILG